MGPGDQSQCQLEPEYANERTDDDASDELIFSSLVPACSQVIYYDTTFNEDLTIKMCMSLEACEQQKYLVGKSSHIHLGKDTAIYADVLSVQCCTGHLCNNYSSPVLPLDEVSSEFDRAPPAFDFDLPPPFDPSLTTESPLPPPFNFDLTTTNQPQTTNLPSNFNQDPFLPFMHHILADQIIVPVVQPSPSPLSSPPPPPPIPRTSTTSVPKLDSPHRDIHRGSAKPPTSRSAMVPDMALRSVMLVPRNQYLNQVGKSDKPVRNVAPGQWFPQIRLVPHSLPQISPKMTKTADPYPQLPDFAKVMGVSAKPPFSTRLVAGSSENKFSCLLVVLLPLVQFFFSIV